MDTKLELLIYFRSSSFNILQILIYGLKYIAIDLNNLNITYEIQKETWPDDSDYDDLYDKTLNGKDDNCFLSCLS